MRSVRINTGESYPVTIGKGLLRNIGQFLKEFVPRRALVLTDERVYSHYGDALRHSLNEVRADIAIKVVAQGEVSKSLATYGEILEEMAQLGIQRGDTLIAFGGGVVGDLGGFLAASYLRGIDCVQVPTSLLAAVDSSVGGKTALNLKAGKNLVGAFKQPKAVFCDCELFQTMEDIAFADGVAESIKYGILRDPELFEMFDKPLTRTDARLSDVVERGVRHKAEIVTGDEFDRRERQLLNLGHTIGHAIESCSDFAVSHGHAVSIGMAIMARSSAHSGTMTRDDAQRILDVLQVNVLPVECDYSTEELFLQVYRDKKCAGDGITIVEPVAVGSCRLRRIPISDFAKIIEMGRGTL